MKVMKKRRLPLMTKMIKLLGWAEHIGRFLHQIMIFFLKDASCKAQERLLMYMKVLNMGNPIFARDFDGSLELISCCTVGSSSKFSSFSYCCAGARLKDSFLLIES